MRFGLSDATIQKIQQVFARYPQVEKAILYGSRAMGRYHPGSDIDLTLCGDDSLTWEVLAKIIWDLDDLLLPYTFDLSLYRDIDDPDVRDHIRRVGVIFYQRQSYPQPHS